MQRTRRLLTGTGLLLSAAAMGTSLGVPLASQPASASGHGPAVLTAAKKATPKPFFKQTLKGSKKTKTFNAKKKWQLAYHYNCGTTKGSFVLWLRPSHGHAVKITSQRGYGGGGSRTEAKGHYHLTATTKCKWAFTATNK